VKRRNGWWWPAGLGGLMFLLLLWGRAAQAELESSPLFPIPDILRPNIAFWKQIFTALDTNQGVLHDSDDVSIIYHTFHDLPEAAQQRQDVLDTYRYRYRRMLETLAQGKRYALDSEEERVLALFKGKQTPTFLSAAAENIRFQSGIRSRFAEGLVRSWTYLPEIERLFAVAGLPRELTLLPHVESSFNHRAYSHAGAAGLWQFTRGTGQRFLRIDRRVDERLNIRLSTIAAAKLLREHYEDLGTWPLAITAYNHGLNGMKQAVAMVGTKDFGTIIERYRGPLFGFASRNFYAEFLAAVEVTRHYRQYFPDLTPDRSPVVRMAEAGASHDTLPVRPVATAPPPRQEYRVQPGDTLSAIARRFGTTAPTLAVLNGLQQRGMLKPGQALVLPPVASSQEVVAGSTPPRGTPEPAKRPTPTAPTTPPAVRRTAVAKAYQVRPGDTLWSIAQRFGTTVPTLVAINSLKQRTLKPGQVLTLPPAAPREVTAVSVPSQRTAAPAELLTIVSARVSPTALAAPISAVAEWPQIASVAMQIVSKGGVHQAND
jgi:membrane-bound lytic murein transglycosylase D